MTADAMGREEFLKGLLGEDSTRSRKNDHRRQYLRSQRIEKFEDGLHYLNSGLREEILNGLTIQN